MISSSSSNKSTSVIGIVIVLLIVATVIGLWLIKSQSSDNEVMRQITYHVGASGGFAQIIYTDASGNNTKPDMYTTPFTRTVSLPIGAQVYLTASNPSQTGEVYCMIKINNQDWKESRATHPVDSVACGGIVR